jgi:two-component system cell cycle response regulator CpdR
MRRERARSGTDFSSSRATVGSVVHRELPQPPAALASLAAPGAPGSVRSDSVQAGRTTVEYAQSNDLPSWRNGEGMPPMRLPRILLVDDEPVVLLLMRRALTEAGYEVLSATNGVEALELAAAAGPAVDAVVTDLQMPQMGGDALAAALRQADPNLPILFVSGFKRGQVPALPGPVLAKPFTPDELISAISLLLSSPFPDRQASA